MKPRKITLSEMRAGTGPDIEVHCTNPHIACTKSEVFNVDNLPGDLSLSDLETGLVCSACGYRGAEVRPFHWHHTFGERPVARKWPAHLRRKG